MQHDAKWNDYGVAYGFVSGVKHEKIFDPLMVVKLVLQFAEDIVVSLYFFYAELA